MWNFQEVKKIEYQGNYVYLVIFDDGIEGELDFSEFLSHGPVFQALQDYSLFAQASVDGGTITWPNGADIAPETLYEKILDSQRLRHQSA